MIAVVLVSVLAVGIICYKRTLKSKDLSIIHVRIQVCVTLDLSYLTFKGKRNPPANVHVPPPNGVHAPITPGQDDIQMSGMLQVTLQFLQDTSFIPLQTVLKFRGLLIEYQKTSCVDLHVHVLLHNCM